MKDLTSKLAEQMQESAKLDEEIKIRKAMQKEQEQKTKAILQKLSKLQEYNEINDMRAIFMSKQIQNILEKLY